MSFGTMFTLLVATVVISTVSAKSPDNGKSAAALGNSENLKLQLSLSLNQLTRLEKILSERKAEPLSLVPLPKIHPQFNLKVCLARSCGSSGMSKGSSPSTSTRGCGQIKCATESHLSIRRRGRGHLHVGAQCEWDTALSHCG